MEEKFTSPYSLPSRT